MTEKPSKSKSPAQWAYERIILYLKNFEEQLDHSEEVAMGFVGGDAGVLRIEGMGYFDPDIVTFYGADASGSRTQLVAIQMAPGSYAGTEILDADPTDVWPRLSPAAPGPRRHGVTWPIKSIRDSPTVQIKGTAAMADHKHGEMNTEVQEKTFEGFMRFTTRTVIVILVLLIGMAIFIT